VWPQWALSEDDADGKHGSDIVLPDLLALLAGDCEFRNKLGNQGCGAIYPALGRAQKRNPPLEFR
jgi:hypothetical protein